MQLKKLLFCITLVIFISNSNLQAQSTDEDISDKISAGLSLNQDAFFGFNPMMTLGYELSETSALTFYGIQWGGGNPGGSWGNWTEFGIGYNITAGNFDINPQLGFTMGNLLSSGTSGPGIVGDGIVPNLTVNYGSDKFEGQFYFGYYGALDNTEAGQSTLNYIHYWANFGYKVSSFFSFGAHFEELSLTGGETNGGGSLDSQVQYVWLGPYLQVQKGNAGLRFSFGANIADEDDRGFDGDFYKLTFFLNL